MMQRTDTLISAGDMKVWNWTGTHIWGL